MIVIPAIDIKKGKCVRLTRGIKASETVYSDDPTGMAKRWVSKGAAFLHVVDLDGAFDGRPQNIVTIREIINSVDVPVQVGGGIRSLTTIESYINMGINRIILGTVALENPVLLTEACRKYPGKIAVAIDVKDAKVAVAGWTKTAEVSAIDFVKRLEGVGVAIIIYTDTYRDGTEVGISLEGIRQVAEATTVPVIASGGVSNIEDIKRLLVLQDYGVVGVITGRAIYTGSLDLEEAIRITRDAGM